MGLQQQAPFPLLRRARDTALVPDRTPSRTIGAMREPTRQRSWRQRPGDPETDVVFPVADDDRVAVGRAEDPRIGAPGATAGGPNLAHPACPGGAVGRRAAIAVVLAVLHPFPHIPVHLVETPRVGLEGVDRHRLLTVLALGAAAIGETAIIVGLARRDRRTPPEWRRGAGAGDVFPLAPRSGADRSCRSSSTATPHRPWRHLQLTLITGCLPRPQPSSVGL